MVEPWKAAQAVQQGRDVLGPAWDHGNLANLVCKVPEYVLGERTGVDHVLGDLDIDDVFFISACKCLDEAQ